MKTSIHDKKKKIEHLELLNELFYIKNHKKYIKKLTKEKNNRDQIWASNMKKKTMRKVKLKRKEIKKHKSK